MVYVPSAERYGFSLDLDEGALREILNGSDVRAVLSETAGTVRAAVISHVQATASDEDAANYVASMFQEDAFSDEYGFDFSNPYSLGSRAIAVIGVRPGRGPDPAAKPPMVTEADHHSLTSVAGFMVGGDGEDIR